MIKKQVLKPDVWVFYLLTKLPWESASLNVSKIVKVKVSTVMSIVIYMKNGA